MTTRYPLAPLLAHLGDISPAELAERLGLSHARGAELAERGLTENQVEEYAVRRLKVLPYDVPGWRTLWMTAVELERFVDGAPLPADDSRKRRV